MFNRVAVGAVGEVSERIDNENNWLKLEHEIRVNMFLAKLIVI